MLRLIVEKELLDNVLNFRFLAVCVVAVLLILSSIIVLAQRYGAEAADYYSRVSLQDEFIDTYGHMNRAGWMSRLSREPSRYSVLVTGLDREASQENFVSNPVPALLSRLDLVSIVTLVMSLVAILFSHSLISGEREDGMLKLMLATGASRGVILFGKYLGGVISLLVPFTLGMLAALAYLSLGSSVQLESADLGVTVLLLLVSYAYIAAFCALGLFFSARSATSDVAVLKSLFAWVILVLVLPNISPFLAAQLYRIPSRASIDQQTNRLLDVERDEIWRARRRELVRTKYADIAEVFSLSQNEVQKKVDSDPAFKSRLAEYSKDAQSLIEQVNREQQQKADVIQEAFNVRSENQEALAKALAYISPLSNFVFASTDLTETGLEQDIYWGRQAGEYDRMFWAHVERQYGQEKAKNPAYDSNDYLNLRDRPRFKYQPPSFSARAEMILLPFGVLVLFNALFLWGAFVGFLKYDVR
jgi:ABC-type transport system involved in multi-copper enzyme maturation permease subunit